VVKPKPANPSGPGLAALNPGGGKAISFSIVLVAPVPLYQLRTHLTDRVTGPIPEKSNLQSIAIEADGCGVDDENKNGHQI
jgi:hypothetical protein